MAVQIEVYLTKRDEEHLIRSLQDQLQLVLLRVLCFSENERFVESLADLGKYPTDGQIALALPEFQQDLIIDVYPEGHRRLHTSYSPVIEFNRSSFLSPKRLKPGQIVYFPDGKTGRKSEAFQKWAKRVFHYLRAHLHPWNIPVKSFLGEETLSLIQQNNLDLSIW